MLDVPAEAAGERLDQFLAGHLGSRAAATRAVEAGAQVDGRARPKSHRLEGGERIELPEAVTAAESPPHRGPAPTVVWEDEHLAVIDKPAGLVVHPGAGRSGGTLVDLLAGFSVSQAATSAARPGIVHRLDRDTSGLLVVARSEEAHERLSELVKRHGLERTYLALVRGAPASRSGRIEARRSGATATTARATRSTRTRPGRRSRTSELVETRGEYALLRVTLETTAARIRSGFTSCR